MSGTSTVTPPLRLHGGYTDSFTFGLLLGLFCSLILSFLYLFPFLSSFAAVRNQTCASGLLALPCLLFALDQLRTTHIPPFCYCIQDNWQCQLLYQNAQPYTTAVQDRQVAVVCSVSTLRTGDADLRF